jgi:hypothetical protein
MASYDEMSPTNRRNLFEGLASLSGLQEGPKNALPDGTRYEYDAVLKRTVEITPSGERFPVALVDGKLKRDLEKIACRKGGGYLECGTSTRSSGDIPKRRHHETNCTGSRSYSQAGFPNKRNPHHGGELAHDGTPDETAVRRTVRCPRPGPALEG